jgi:acyl-CoA reductase-like NAD-dependent aldehyde dehydrogenase
MTETKVRDVIIAVRNPADGRVVGEVPNEMPEAVAVAARELRLFQPEWEAIGPRGRKAWLLKFQNWVLDRADHIADVVQSESAKTRAEALTEPTVVADLLSYWAGIAITKKLTTAYRPYPLVGVITPWNFPFLMPGLDVVPALAAGAAVLLKPSEVTPLSAVEFLHGWTEIGAPPVLALATGYGDTGTAVIDTVDYVQFTGSTATGRKVAVACARRLIPYSLELGGKDPAIVLADADLERTANGIAWGGLMNSGQVCVSVERVYVEAPVYDDFVAKLTRKVGKLGRAKTTAAANKTWVRWPPSHSVTLCNATSTKPSRPALRR